MTTEVVVAIYVFVLGMLLGAITMGFYILNKSLSLKVKSEEGTVVINLGALKPECPNCGKDTCPGRAQSNRCASFGKGS